jgi:hypothetical protein
MTAVWHLHLKRLTAQKYKIGATHIPKWLGTRAYTKIPAIMPVESVIAPFERELVFLEDRLREFPGTRLAFSAAFLAISNSDNSA